MIETKDISVIVPVKNESGNINGLIDEIGEALKNSNYEIIYVNDGSTDDTGIELKNNLKLSKKLRVVSHIKSLGQSAALRSGILASKSKLIATLDGDGQNDPSDLPKMIELINQKKTSMVLVGIKVFHKQLYIRLPYFDHMHRFLSALVLREGGNVLDIEVNHRQRTVGKSNYTNIGRLFVGIFDMLGVMWLIKRMPKDNKSEEIYGD